MVRDRAKDPKRVPSLGISDPISHVNLRDPGYGKVYGKYDSDGLTDEWREAQNLRDEEDTKKYNERNASDAKVIKIDTDPAKGK